MVNQHQGKMVPSQRVVATCRLPWHFNVGKQQGSQGAPAAFAGGIIPCKSEADSPIGQLLMTLDTPKPPPYARAELGVPSVAPLTLSPPGSFSRCEGDHQGASFVPGSNTQAQAARGAGAKGGGPMQRKRS